MGLSRHHKLLVTLAGLVWLTLASAPLAAEPTRVVVFAAASMAEALQSLTARYNERNGAAIVPSFAASSTLARQIESGAPADIFISANRRWMDYLEEHGRIDPASRCDLLRNRLVLVAPTNSAFDIAIAPDFALAEALGGKRLAIGDPDHVPAGLYGRQALEALGVWPSIADRLVRSANVRAALALVARGEVAAAIVYATDADLSERVRVVDSFPAASHDAIVYPAARVAGSEGEAAAAFFDYLVSDEGRAVLAGFGFEVEKGIPCSP
jgi:molybdate transport system substrate-binding protein